MVREIPLRRRDGTIRAYALVDDEDFERVSFYRWCLNGKDGKQYVMSSLAGYLHRFVMGLRVGDLLQVDHVSGDGLDNRRENLRVASPAENGQNRRSGFGRYSRYRGVCWDKSKGRWVAYARIAGRQHFLGRYDDEMEAARVASAFRAERMPFANEYPLDSDMRELVELRRRPYPKRAIA